MWLVTWFLQFLITNVIITNYVSGFYNIPIKMNCITCSNSYTRRFAKMIINTNSSKINNTNYTQREINYKKYKKVLETPIYDL